MALLLHSSSPSSLTTTKKTNLNLPKPPYSYHLSIRSQDISSEDTTTAATTDSSSSASSTGLGFGSSSDPKPLTTKPKKQKQKVKRERATVVRRVPAQKPIFGSEKEEAQAKQGTQNESAFLLTWLGLGAIILVQGIALAASGFLPEEWDGFFVKYLYPSFTPTVFLFVAGTVAYGVFKYLQNEKFNSEN